MTDRELELLAMIDKYELALSEAERIIDNQTELLTLADQKCLGARDLMVEALFRFEAIRNSIAHYRYADALRICTGILGLHS